MDSKKFGRIAIDEIKEVLSGMELQLGMRGDDDRLPHTEAVRVKGRDSREILLRVSCSIPSGSRLLGWRLMTVGTIAKSL